MTPRRALVVFVAGLFPAANVAALGQSQPVAADLKLAARCKVGPYRFQRGTGTPVHMTTSADGGYCWTTPVFRSGGGFQGGATTPPKHGEASTSPNKDGINRFVYKATPGYVGTDSMIVSLNPGSISLYVDIDVVSP